MDIFSYMLGQKSGGGSPGGGADWNASEGEAGYIKNRTHYEEVTEVGGDTLTWDGNTEGLESVGPYYRVSDATPTLSDFANGATVEYETGLIDNFTYEDMQEMYERFGTCMGNEWLVIPYDGFNMMGELVFEKKGFYWGPTGRVSITIPGYTGFTTTTTVLKTIDSKYLPEALHFGEEMAFEPIVWDGNTEGLEVLDTATTGWNMNLYKIYDKYIPAEDVEGITINISGGEEMYVPNEEAITAESVGWNALGGQIFAFNGLVDETAPFASKGVWVINLKEIGMPEGSTYTINPATTVKTLDEKYMPILTSPSGKKYKLTVDDSGTVSAVEVTG